jgi:preprotein translocase subunit SecD
MPMEILGGVFPMKAAVLLGALVSIGACVSTPAGHESSNAGSSRAGGIRFVYNVDIGHAGTEHADRDAVLAHAVAVMQRRVDALFKQGVVRAVANGIEVVLSEDVLATLERYRRIAQIPGVFHVRLVDDGSTYMTTLVERFRHEIYSFEFENVVAAEDHWNGPEGSEPHRDPYLTAAERDPLVAVLHKLSAASPLPPDREILVETYGESSRSYRSYLVASSGGIDNADIEVVEVAPGVDGQPEVIITLTAEGRRKFGDMTEAAIGRKIAIVIDGRIMSAPIIIGPIRNGRVHVRFGVYPSADENVQRAEAEDLAALLRSGPLPAPLSLEREEKTVR